MNFLCPFHHVLCIFSSVHKCLVYTTFTAEIKIKRLHTILTKLAYLRDLDGLHGAYLSIYFPFQPRPVVSTFLNLRIVIKGQGGVEEKQTAQGSESLCWETQLCQKQPTVKTSPFESVLSSSSDSSCPDNENMINANVFIKEKVGLCYFERAVRPMCGSFA